MSGEHSQPLPPGGLLLLSPLVPQVARQFPEPMPLVLKVRLGGTPVATLHTNNATLRLQPLVEVLASASNSAFHSLFSLHVVSEVGWAGLAGRVLIVRETSLPVPVSSFALLYPHWSPCYSFNVPEYFCLRTLAHVIHFV